MEKHSPLLASPPSTHLHRWLCQLGGAEANGVLLVASFRQESTLSDIAHMPQVHDRYDPEAASMAKLANPEMMLEAIKETQDLGEELIKPGAEAKLDL